MSDFNRGLSRPAFAGAPDMSVDAGLRAFMLGVYNKLGLGLALSAALAWVTGTVPAVQSLLWAPDEAGRLHTTLLGMVVRFAPLGLILFSAFARRQTPATAAFIYWSIVALIGASMGVWFLAYDPMAIVQAFLVTACAFGGLSLVGYTTKRDLTGMGAFMVMGLIGLIIAMLVNMFLHSGAMAFAINLIGVAIFAGLTAWDTQKLKMTYYQVGGDQAAMGMATSYGALTLYLDFINLFQFLLALTGGSRR